MSTTLFENKNLVIQYNQEKAYLLLKWNGFASGEQFRMLAGEVIKAIEKTGATRLLSDNTNWKVISPNDQGWAAYTWFPKAEEKGIRKLATVLSTDYFNRVAERSIETLAEVDCMHIKNFYSMDQALTWLVDTKTVEKC